MGRRALKRLDPQLDLSTFLYELEDFPQPFDPAEFFERDAPFEIEVGSGKGLFIANAAAGQPAHNFLGIEIARKYARFCAGRLAKRDLSWAKMLSGDGLRFFREYLSDASVHAVHVYFPDPWWKKRHHKRRVMQEPFLKDIERVLQIDGILHFWTDVQEYFDESLALIEQTTGLIGPEEVEVNPPEHELDYRTHFEHRMRLNGEAVYRAQFRRR